MINYNYPKVVGGYRWNLLQRCLHEVGVEPINLTDVSDETVLSFTVALTDVQKIKLDILMISNPTFPPVSIGTVFKIKDLWEKLADFRAASGINFKIYYSESIINSRSVDTIEVHCPSVLTQQQQINVRNAYTNLMTLG